MRSVGSEFLEKFPRILILQTADVDDGNIMH